MCSEVIEGDPIVERIVQLTNLATGRNVYMTLSLNPARRLWLCVACWERAVGKLTQPDRHRSLEDKHV